MKSGRVVDTSTRGPAIGFVLEQSLGHVSHGRSIRRSLSATDRARLRFRELEFEPTAVIDRLPPRTNWTIRSGLAARSAVRDMQDEGPLDALFVHTHVPATLLGAVMRRIPTVVSIDATPRQIDALGTTYDHRVHPEPVEWLKHRAHAGTFHRAASLVTWSEWAADSLVSDYGIDRHTITVIPPGVVSSLWRRSGSRPLDDGVTRILFVGGDFERKGGHLLVDAMARLNDDPELRAGKTRIELHLVTSHAVDAGSHVRVHRGLTPNSPELIELYHRCDIFALPSLGDCSPVVLAEAAAAGLPAIATDIGAIRESVIDGTTGHLVEPRVEPLTNALRRLVVDPDHRRRLGEAASDHARRTMDAETNANRVLDVLVEHAQPRPAAGRVLLTVSGNIDSDIEKDVSMGERPLADFLAISKAADATLLDRDRVRKEGSRLTSMIRHLAGSNVAMAHHVYRLRSDVDVVVTDGEQVGLPLTVMLRLGGRRRMRHVMIGHRLSARKKSLPIRLLGLSGGVDEVVVYSTSQLYVAQRLFRRIGHRVRFIDFMVDSEFFSPTNDLPRRGRCERPLLCAAGREFRDYPTLIEAVRDLDVDVLIASASPWSRRPDNARETDVPANVTVIALTQRELRDQLDRADVVMVPLEPNDFQAGVTTILEGMAMARPVICTATVGQIDVVIDGVNGLYVPPGDVAALRRSITDIVANPEEASRMGRAGRHLVETRADVRHYAETIADIVRWHLGVSQTDDSRCVQASS